MPKYRSIDARLLWAARATKGWTLTQLAAVSGVSRVTVRRIEAGNEAAHLVTVRALEAALGATLAPQGGNDDHKASDDGNGNHTGGDSGGSGSAG